MEKEWADQESNWSTERRKERVHQGDGARLELRGAVTSRTLQMMRGGEGQRFYQCLHFPDEKRNESRMRPHPKSCLFAVTLPSTLRVGR